MFLFFSQEHNLLCPWDRCLGDHCNATFPIYDEKTAGIFLRPGTMEMLPGRVLHLLCEFLAAVVTPAG